MPKCFQMMSSADNSKHVRLCLCLPGFPHKLPSRSEKFRIVLRFSIFQVVCCVVCGRRVRSGYQNGYNVIGLIEVTCVIYQSNQRKTVF